MVGAAGAPAVAKALRNGVCSGFPAASVAPVVTVTSTSTPGGNAEEGVSVAERPSGATVTAAGRMRGPVCTKNVVAPRLAGSTGSENVTITSLEVSTSTAASLGTTSVTARGEVSRWSVSCSVVVLPAASRAVTEITFSPSPSVFVPLSSLSETAAGAPSIVAVRGVASLT